MSAENTRAASLRRMALACALLVIAIVGISAFIRLSAVGLGCTPWPACYGQVQAAMPSAVIDVARLMHRVLAVALLPLILLLVAGGFVRSPDAWEQRWLSVQALALVLFLAVLGRWTAGAKVPAVALGNLLGGFVLFALCVRMALAGRNSQGSGELSDSARRWRRIAICAVLLQVTLGALVSSSLAGLSCPGFPTCALPTPIAWEALNPWHVPHVDPSTWPINPAGAIAQWLHRLVALLAAVAVLMAAAKLWRCGWRRAGLLLLVLLALQMSLGGLLVLYGLPLALAVMHNLLAALVLAALFAVP
jgi:cytochrome c oxidase assembly protein subunit 15